MLQLLILLSIVAFSALFGSVIPTEVKVFLYSVSLSIKEILLFIMPFIIFSLIFSSINNLKHSAMKLVILIITSIFLSNLISSLMAYFLGHIIINNVSVTQSVGYYEDGIKPLWSLRLPKLVSNFQALACGFLSGVTLSKLAPKSSKEFSHKILDLTLFIVKTLFAPMIPIFVLGFVLKMQHDDTLSIALENYSIAFIIIISVTYVYILFLYGIANTFRIKAWIISIYNMIPAFVTAISTMSSSATIPLTLEGSKKNVKQDDTVSSVVPITANFHLVGDCFFIITLSVIILGDNLLYTKDCLTFLLCFLLFKFTVVAIPAGGIIVMLPLLEKYLGFTPEMSSLITALYILLDPIITSANVMGNGAFAMIFSKFYNKLK